MRQVGYLQRLYRDARSTEHKKFMNKVRLLSVPTIEGIERRSTEVVPQSLCKVFVVALSLMTNQGYWKLQSTCGVNLKKRMKFTRISRVISSDNRRI